MPKFSFGVGLSGGDERGLTLTGPGSWKPHGWPCQCGPLHPPCTHLVHISSAKLLCRIPVKARVCTVEVHGPLREDRGPHPILWP